LCGFDAHYNLNPIGCTLKDLTFFPDCSAGIHFGDLIKWARAKLFLPSGSRTDALLQIVNGNHS
jgi:hypothetical protein